MYWQYRIVSNNNKLYITEVYFNDNGDVIGHIEPESCFSDGLYFDTIRDIEDFNLFLKQAIELPVLTEDELLGGKDV